MFKLGQIIGTKVIAIKGTKKRKNQKHIEPTYILFDDGETYIELEEQDYYTFHDCSTLAREIRIYKNKKLWEKLIVNSRHIGDANENII